MFTFFLKIGRSRVAFCVAFAFVFLLAYTLYVKNTAKAEKIVKKCLSFFATAIRVVVRVRDCLFLAYTLYVKKIGKCTKIVKKCLNFFYNDYLITISRTDGDVCPYAFYINFALRIMHFYSLLYFLGISGIIIL